MGCLWQTPVIGSCNTAEDFTCHTRITTWEEVGSFVEIQKLDICVALPARWLSPVNSAIGFHLWHLSSSSLQYPILKKTKTNTKVIQRQRLSLVNSNTNQPTIPDPKKDKYKDDTKTNITILSSVPCQLCYLVAPLTPSCNIPYLTFPGKIFSIKAKKGPWSILGNQVRPQVRIFCHLLHAL